MITLEKSSNLESIFGDQGYHWPLALQTSIEIRGSFAIDRHRDLHIDSSLPDLRPSVDRGGPTNWGPRIH